ncbi:fasciclin domain-containing protein [Chitinophaga nivalis]|uniref:Fasciclin domain-containing protein n=1 Tax=Chitinophaga nivalis TaxID=2991709 RepID=A0ABT3IEG6_9BACT|nr:fasciclin domain-containing protein [Chitinophaga nivalis]MCW3467968.1 fasciclin domain-containing protein [Chitinophaga nivalis]MCW3482341.1 fasciclin domain-containing protein [Chitinophaga nivalis]
MKRLWLLGCTLLSACSLGGLDMQESWNFEPHVLDPHTFKNTWQYMQDRNRPGQDSVFNDMLQAIAYAGIDSSVYTQQGRTYILLHRDAVLRLDKKKVTPDCYWGKYLVPDRDAAGNIIPGKFRAARSWQEYRPEQVKAWLLYLIVQGEYTFSNIGPENETVQTLLPPQADTANPTSIMTLRLTNDRNSTIKLNDFLNSTTVTNVRTGGILNTNGPAHVVDRVVEFRTKP